MTDAFMIPDELELLEFFEAEPVERLRGAQPEVPAVSLGHLLGDGEPQPPSAGVARARRVAPRMALHHREVLLRRG
jgi:hypothetical protein